MIPSGLQALMEASAVLQQQASQTAPGPQGQQPTVASQVMQQAQQAAQPPQLQDIGKQAGIAGQLMAQQQQQQQQMAQNPQAVAQMAAQMLKQQGVAGLPVNMQFREGGIIGYAGPEGSVVANPVADRELAEIEDVDERLGAAKRRRIQAERERLEAMKAPYARAFGMSPTELEDLEYGLRMAENEYERAGPSEAAAARAAVQAAFNQERARRSGQVRGGERATDPARLSAIPGETGRLAGDVAKPFVTAGRNFAGTVADASQMLLDAARQSGVGQAASAAFARGADQEGVQSLLQDSKRKPDFEPIATPPSKLQYTGPDEQFARPARAEAPPSESRPTAPQPSGIAAIAPQRAQLPTAPTYQSIRTEEPPELVRRRQEFDEAIAARKAAAARQEDLTPQGIAALEAAKAERQRLLESARSRDIFDRLNALFVDLRTKGNQTTVVENAIKTREEAAITANLLHEDSVFKLRQAKQARDLGEMDKAIALQREGLKEAQDSAKLVQAQDRISADLAKSQYEVEGREATSSANRINDLKMKLADLAQREEVRRDQKLRDQYIAAAGQLDRASSSLQKAVQDRFKTYFDMQRVPGSKPDPKIEQDIKNFIAQESGNRVARLEQVVNDLADKVLGTTPVARPSTSNAVDFSKLPTK